MGTTLLTLSVRRQRDILMARQRARQIANLLGFEPEAQLEISTAVFEIAHQLLRRWGEGSLQFLVDDQTLRIVCPETEAAPRLDRPLPRKDLPLTGADLLWTVEALHQLTPLNLFEEIQLQNRELMGALHDLKTWRGQLQPAKQPTAA